MPYSKTHNSFAAANCWDVCMWVLQVTFRINMYKMSADYYQARDQAKYQTPIQLATVLGSLLSLAVPVMDTQSLVRGSSG
jgi:hypothetical protein